MGKMSNSGRKTHIEELWEDIVAIVDKMVCDKKVSDLPEGTLGEGESRTNLVETVKVVIPSNAKVMDELEQKTLVMLEEMIALMYFGTDLQSPEMRSDSSFLAKLSTRLSRKVWLMLEAPMAVGMKENDTSVYLLINPIRLRFTASTVGEILAIVRHELYHILYSHLAEAKQYPNDAQTQYILNIAQDCEINQSPLIKHNLPEGTITLDYVREKTGQPDLEEASGYLEYYKALMACEEYKKETEHLGRGGYKVLTEDKDGNYEKSKTELHDMVNANPHDTWGGNNVSQDTAEKAMSGIVRDTYNSLTDKERGLLSHTIKGQVAKIDHTPEVDWRDKIRRQHGKMKNQNKRKTLARPNRRYPNRLDLKGKLPDYSIRIVMALDVSGSVSDGALSYAMGEGYHLSKELDAPLTLLQIDSELLSEQEMRRPTDFTNVKLNGRGGTRFQPAFDYLTKHKYTDKNTMLVYVTDGYGERESEITRNGFTNVLWLLVDTDREEVLSCDGKGRVELLNNDRDYH